MMRLHTHVPPEAIGAEAGRTALVRIGPGDEMQVRVERIRARRRIILVAFAEEREVDLPVGVLREDGTAREMRIAHCRLVGPIDVEVASDQAAVGGSLSIQMDAPAAGDRRRRAFCLDRIVHREEARR